MDDLNIFVYMDDFVIMAHSRDELVGILLEFIIFLLESDEFLLQEVWP